MAALEEPKWLTYTSDGSGGRVGLVGLAGVDSALVSFSLIGFCFSAIAEPSTSTGIALSSGPFVRV
jgi:hypothetical protein